MVADTLKPVGAGGVRRVRFWRRLVLTAFAIAWVATSYWGATRTLPPGTHLDSPWYAVPIASVSFIPDVTAADAYGRPVVSQGIFDQVLKVVRSSRRFIVMDYFLFNDQGVPGGAATTSGPPIRAISGELRDALIEQRRAHPDIKILLVTDPINEVYGSVPSRDLILLRAAGVEIAVTDLDALRDSNPLYSGLWRLGIRWWDGKGAGGGWLPNPLDESDMPITFGAWARLINFKANHRKVIIADDGGGGVVGVVGSANPHDASSAHSNIAARVAGPALLPLVRSEMDIARFSGWKGTIAVPEGQASALGDADADVAAGRAARVKVITEGAILDELQQKISAAGKGDSIDIAMFYLCDRAIVEGLLDASSRGAAIRLILDPNKDAFGHEKSGIPNRPAASELVSASDGGIHVRWYRTHGEQFHTKLVMIYGSERLWMTLGSANLTRRNLGDYNLEADLAIEVSRTSPLAVQALEYFDNLWSNRAGIGIEYTTDFAAYADPAQTRYWLYRLMEGTGLSTF
jgi:phosphatidylserine/phosphatidylglycerophosphate/cardiolipin synthase-like enzyme